MGQCSTCCTSAPKSQLPYYKICLLQDGNANLKNSKTQSTTNNQNTPDKPDTKKDSKFYEKFIETHIGSEKLSLQIWSKNCLSNTKSFKEPPEEKRIMNIYYQNCNILVICINMEDSGAIKKTQNKIVPEVHKLSANSDNDSQQPIPVFQLGFCYNNDKRQTEIEVIELAKKYDWGFGFVYMSEEMDNLIIEFSKISNQVGVKPRQTEVDNGEIMQTYHEDNEEEEVGRKVSMFDDSPIEQRLKKKQLYSEKLMQQTEFNEMNND